jgi:Fic family protein
MKIPQSPPDAMSLFSELATKQPEVLLKFIAQYGPVDHKARYLHWNEFRFQKPAAGLTPPQAWSLTRMARSTASQTLALKDPRGAPFTLCEPAPLRALLWALDMNTGGALAADATALSSGEGRLHLARSLAEEPFASSFIEGAATTRQIAKKLIFDGRRPRTRDERMVLNNHHAMEFVKAHRGEELTIPMLLELHRLVTDDTLASAQDAGRIRTTDDIRVVDETSNEILHQPPPAALLEERLGALLAFANRTQAAHEWIHPLVKAFILHFMLAYEHPFVDGNGRVARALFYWAALREGYWLIEFVSISSVIAEARVAYGRSFLDVETDRNDLTYFLVHHAETLAKAVDRLTAFVARKRDEVAAFEKHLADKRRPDAFNHRQSWLLNELARQRMTRVSIAEHEKTHAVSYLTARNDLESLVKRRLLKKSRDGRASAYLPASDLLARLT